MATDISEGLPQVTEPCVQSREMVYPDGEEWESPECQRSARVHSLSWCPTLAWVHSTPGCKERTNTHVQCRKCEESTCVSRLWSVVRHLRCCLVDKYLLDQTEVINELSLPLSQLIDNLQNRHSRITAEHINTSTQANTLTRNTPLESFHSWLFNKGSWAIASSHPLS